MRAVIKGFVATGALLGAMGMANAADLGLPAPVIVPEAAPYIFDWSGHYIGIHGLYATADADISGAVTGTLGADGTLGGLQLGYNWQNGHTVYGIEASGSFGSLGGSSLGVTGEAEWLGMARGKIGYAFDYPLFTNIIPLEGHTTDHFMIYGVGGLIAAGVNADATGIGGTTDSVTSYGWTIGIGVEKRFWDTVSLTLEYDYFSLSDTDINPGAQASFDADGHIFKVGLNFRNLWN